MGIRPIDINGERQRRSAADASADSAAGVSRRMADAAKRAGSGIATFATAPFKIKELRRDLEKKEVEIAEKDGTIRELQRDARRDRMTGLGNRNAFYDATARMVQGAENRSRRGEPRDVVAVYFDLDGLKKANDTYGHATGDALLRRFSGSLKKMTRSGEEAFRIGGDEFVILAVVRDDAPARLLADKIAQRVLGAARISVSYGYAALSEAHGAEGMIKLADSRMYEMKQACRTVHR